MRQRSDAADPADADRPAVRLLESSLDGAEEVPSSLDVAAGGPRRGAPSWPSNWWSRQNLAHRQRIAAVVAVGLAVLWLGETQLRGAPEPSPAAPAEAAATPSTSPGDAVKPIGRAQPPVAVAPLCARPLDRSLGIAGVDDSLACPKVTPGGDYRSAFVMGAAVTPFIVTVPAGWTVSALPGGNGLDLRALNGSAGVSFIVDPVPDVTQSFDKSSPALGIDPMRDLAAWITGRPFVLADAPPTQTTIASHPGWVVTLKEPLRGASADVDCRIAVPCLPLFRLAQGPRGELGRGVREPLAAGLPAGQPARFVLFQALGGQPVLAWEWVLGDEGALALDTITQPVVDSVTY